MTTLETTLGWIGAVLFFWACWLMGSRKQADRRDGMFGFMCVNLCFGVQAVSAGNTPLIVMSIGGVLFQLRAWANWNKYDEPNDSSHPG